jgi:hypothetical protein
MTIQSKREYLQAIRQRYLKASKEAKSPILDEFCNNCGYNRKYAIRLLKVQNKPGRAKKSPGPKTRYQPKQVLTPLKRIWFATDQMCSKKLKAAIPLGYRSMSRNIALSMSRLELNCIP